MGPGSQQHHRFRVNLLADERALGNGLQGTDPPAHLGSPVELQPHPRGGEGVTLSVGHLGGPQGREAEARQGARARASLDAALHHAVLAASPAGACLVTLKDQGGLDLVKLLEQPPVLGCGGRGQWFLCGAHFSCPGPRGLHRKLHSDPSPKQERKVQSLQAEVRNQEVCSRASESICIYPSREAHYIPGRVTGLPATPCLSPNRAGSWLLGRSGQVRDTHLVIPASDAELTTQAVGAGAVINTRAVLEGEDLE